MNSCVVHDDVANKRMRKYIMLRFISDSLMHFVAPFSCNIHRDNTELSNLYFTWSIKMKEKWKTKQKRKFRVCDISVHELYAFNESTHTSAIKIQITDKKQS